MSLAEVTHYGRDQFITTDYALYGIQPGPNTWTACLGHWRAMTMTVQVTTDREKVTCERCLEKLAALAVAALRGGG